MDVGHVLVLCIKFIFTSQDAFIDDYKVKSNCYYSGANAKI